MDVAGHGTGWRVSMDANMNLSKSFCFFKGSLGVNGLGLVNFSLNVTRELATRYPELKKTRTKIQDEYPVQIRPLPISELALSLSQEY